MENKKPLNSFIYKQSLLKLKGFGDFFNYGAPRRIRTLANGSEGATRNCCEFNFSYHILS